MEKCSTWVINTPTTITTAQADNITANTAKNTYPAADATKLAGIEAGAEVNVQADWNQTTTTADDYIKNKPTIPTAADGSETKVTAGTNVTVTGNGTTASPYVVNAFTSMTQAERDTLTATEGIIVYNLTAHKPNYYNGTEWMNFDGTSAKTAIGDRYQGGIIAYILQPGDPGYDPNVMHGIIAAPSDQSFSAEWGCDGTFIGANGTDIGTGEQNTIDIEAGCVTTGTAADICANLVLNGYDDWYLPSQDELNKLYLNKNAVGGFASELYWSSSEDNNDYAWMQDFNNGAPSIWHKSNNLRVRAVRAF